MGCRLGFRLELGSWGPGADLLIGRLCVESACRDTHDPRRQLQRDRVCRTDREQHRRHQHEPRGGLVLIGCGDGGAE